MYGTLAVLVCTLLGANGFPYHSYAANMDTLSYGSSGSNGHGGMVLSRFYSPSLNSRTPAGMGMAAFMINSDDQRASQYYQADRRRQATPEAEVPLQNDVLESQELEQPLATELTEIADPLPTETVDTPTTVKAIAQPELAESKDEKEEEPKESRDIAPASKRRVSRKKQVRRPVEDEEEEDEEDYSSKLPTGAFFPMFFGWGRGRGGAPNGPTAIANAFSTGRGAAATSHATAYGLQQPDPKLLN